MRVRQTAACRQRNYRKASTSLRDEEVREYLVVQIPRGRWMVTIKVTYILIRQSIGHIQDCSKEENGLSTYKTLCYSTKLNAT